MVDGTTEQVEPAGTMQIESEGATLEPSGSTQLALGDEVLVEEVSIDGMCGVY